MCSTLDVCKAISHCSAFTAALAGGRARGLTPFLCVTRDTLQASGGAGMEAIPPVFDRVVLLLTTLLPHEQTHMVCVCPRVSPVYSSEDNGFSFNCCPLEGETPPL